ncbi:MAG: [FeFe] hydrogenase H-cluster maturation GTPase HydF [Erysipelotrichaceae bacterium]|nr:[FeFe] hydrogenase H-cluster maturation GTPase HydF [Erysipelotrichaceae bacterium]
MSLNSTPSAERLHISLFGCRNAGKSSLVNALTNQDVSVVSETKGTTTDPVIKSMELLPIGPVVIIDTPGFDDEGDLGEKRVKKTKETLGRTDLAILVVDATVGLKNDDHILIDLFKSLSIPYLIVMNKEDLLEDEKRNPDYIYVSSTAKKGLYELKELIGKKGVKAVNEKHLLADLVDEGDTVILVIPIDESAPKGRIILPQQMAIRDLLDSHAQALCVQVNELDAAINSLKRPPKMVVTDSQAFKEVAKIVPDNILLTSFSILMARYKGFLETAVEGVSHIKNLKDGDVVLISEGCTHHRQCGDIGTVKLPRWLKMTNDVAFTIETSSGKGFPDDLSPYQLVIHCGGCMVNEREMQTRLKRAITQDVPFTNYGIAIAYMNGILERSLSPFPHLQDMIKD